ncbi:MAG TPA: thiamine pyrophosphate-requiring protein [Terriglobales bacterium]|nr:thiamine pyrophosphate-requiring protein [Terriglobales bacterium]
MGQKTLQVETVAQAWLELLHDRGVDVFLANAGTDFASLVDAFAKRQAEGQTSPRPIVVPHESVAVGMAHGYYLATGRPQAVMVHVTVGTANATCGVITAARGRAPVFLAAGRTPLTEEGLPGSRDLYIHWAQEAFDQAGMLREYVKWDYELRNAAQVESVVDRAFELMLSEPRGPVYVTLPREVLAERLSSISITSPPRRHMTSRAFPDPARIEEAARLLARARRPLILATGAGRDPAAVPALVELAEAGGIGVVEVDPTHVNFPSSHPLHVGYTQPSGVDPAFPEADAVLVVECDVPWYPALAKPAPDAAIIHLGVDPLFARYPMRSFPCDVPILAEPAAALPLLTEALRRLVTPADAGARRAEVAKTHRARRAEWAAIIDAQRGWQTTGFAAAAAALGQVLDETTVVVNEYPLDRRFIGFERPGAFFGQPHASGLGWGLPCALGLKLGDPAKTVIACLGDGSYLFNEPAACHFVSRAQGLPVLTVIFNNAQWEAVRSSTLGVHPEGWAKGTGQFPLTSLSPSPRFEEIVKAFDGHGELVDRQSELVPALQRALTAVRSGRQAVVNILCTRSES